MYRISQAEWHNVGFAEKRKILESNSFFGTVVHGAAAVPKGD